MCLPRHDCLGQLEPAVSCLCQTNAGSSSLFASLSQLPRLHSCLAESVAVFLDNPVNPDPHQGFPALLAAFEESFITKIGRLTMRIPAPSPEVEVLQEGKGDAAPSALPLTILVPVSALEALLFK